MRKKPKKHIPRRCQNCEMWTGVLCRVFPSQAAFEASPYFGGEDHVINDPHGAVFATWPGKNNVGRSVRQYWICCPTHPQCSAFWEPWSPERASEVSPEIQKILEEMRRANEKAIDKQNRGADELYRQQQELKSSTKYTVGIWEESTCANDEEPEESWGRTYLRIMS